MANRLALGQHTSRDGTPSFRVTCPPPPHTPVNAPSAPCCVSVLPDTDPTLTRSFPTLSAQPLQARTSSAWPRRAAARRAPSRCPSCRRSWTGRRSTLRSYSAPRVSWPSRLRSRCARGLHGASGVGRACNGPMPGMEHGAVVRPCAAECGVAGRAANGTWGSSSESWSRRAGGAYAEGAGGTTARSSLGCGRAAAAISPKSWGRFTCRRLRG